MLYLLLMALGTAAAVSAIDWDDSDPSDSERSAADDDDFTVEVEGRAPSGENQNRVDGGVGDDTVSVINSDAGLSVTLGEGADVLRGFQDRSDFNGWDDQLGVVDLDASEDRVAFFTSDVQDGTDSSRTSVNIVRGPDDLEGPGLAAEKIFDDDSLQLRQGPQDTDLAESRAYLAPFELVGNFFLGRIAIDGNEEGDITDTLNDVEVVVNRA